MSCLKNWITWSRSWQITMGETERENASQILTPPSNIGPALLLFFPCWNRSPPPDPRKKWQKKSTSVRIEVHPRESKNSVHVYSKVDLCWGDVYVVIFFDGEKTSEPTSGLQKWSISNKKNREKKRSPLIPFQLFHCPLLNYCNV